MLGCGYQLGWASFAGQLLVGFLGAPPVRYDKAFAKKLGVDKTYIERFLDWDENVKKMMEIPHTCTTQELLIHCVAAKRIIDIYRATAAPVVGLWELFQQLIPRSLADGEEYVHKCLIFRKEEIVLPNGMSMKYPNLRQQKNPDTKKMEWVYGDDATRLYAGKIANNCLAEGTEVLTGRGWVCIESVSDYDVVYDGVEFVQHAGRVCNGVQPCITLDGVLLTEDHFVLERGRWIRASQVQRPDRPDIRDAYRDAPGELQREELAVAVRVPVRAAVREDGGRRHQGHSARANTQLRLYDATTDRREEPHARHDEAPRLYRLAEHARALLQKWIAGVSQLWGSGDSLRLIS